VGFGTFPPIQLPITLLSGVIGVWLFYIEHPFGDTYWPRRPEWSFHAGALLGSAHDELPGVLRWLNANVGIHDVHHMASRISSYRLGEPLADHPELRGVGRLTLRESLRCFRLGLWDEDAGRLVAFRDLRALPLGHAHGWSPGRSGHGPVVGPGSSVEHLGVVAHELVRGEGAEEELAVEAEEIQGGCARRGRRRRGRSSPWPS